jgi:hypothetical protein
MGNGNLVVVTSLEDKTDGVGASTPPELVRLALAWVRSNRPATSDNIFYRWLSSSTYLIGRIGVIKPYINSSNSGSYPLCLE